MNWKEYQELSPKTLTNIYESYGLNVLEEPSIETPAGLIRSARQLAWAANLAHMGLGLISELEELIEAINKSDKTNIQEELIDMLFYVSCAIKLCKDIGIELSQCENYEFTEYQTSCNLLDLSKTISVFSDIPKKVLAYKRTITSRIDVPKQKQFYYAHDIDQKLHDILYHINLLGHTFYIDIEQGLDNNIQKLQGVRYKNGFNENDANSRNLEKEREKLEKK